MALAWAVLRQQLEQVAGGQGGSLEPHGFARLYRAHLQAEEQLAYPAARGLCHEALSAEMSRDMMRRRGLPPG